jgi:hypothetical protein
MKSLTEVGVSVSGGEHKSCKRRMVATSCAFDDIVVGDVIEVAAAGADLFTDGSVDDIVVDDVIEVAAAGADVFTDGSVNDNEVVAAGADLFTDGSVDDIVVDAIGVVGLIAEAGPSPPGC